MVRSAAEAQIDSEGFEFAQTGALEQLKLRWRLNTFSSGATLSLLPSIGTIVLLLYVFQAKVPVWALVAWAVLQGVQLAIFVTLDRRFDPDTATLKQLRVHWKRMQALQLFGSTMYAVVIPALAIVAVGLEAAVLALVGTALFCGVLLVHRSVPLAGYYHIAVMGAALCLAAWLVAAAASWPIVGLVVAMGIALASALAKQERQFVSAAQNEIDRQEADTTVRLLLDAYEQQSSDLLWTVGPRGNLRDVSPHLADTLGTSAAALEGASLIGLFRPGEARDTLARNLIERTAFRDLTIKLRIDGELRFWRLSAAPRADGRTTGVARDVTADRLNEERVAFMAHYDSLTGLANRYRFNERLRRALGPTLDKSANVALFYLDLDDFKSINDTRGHGIGDRLLREVGIRLEQEIRDDDLVARLGGDEFAVLMDTRLGAGVLIERAHRFLSVVRQPYQIEGHSYRVSTSIGVARCIEGDCDAQELMRRADLALFAAKRKGRDNLAIYDDKLDREARDKRELEQDLAEAIARGELRLHYQPVIDLESGRTSGYEALLRWYHPVRGMIAPNDFLPIAEETGLIVPVGEWVVRQAIAETADWPEDLRIAINLSPTQVRNPHLAATIAQAIHGHGLKPERIEFEITEHVLLHEGAASHATLTQLRDLGVRIALDDFGTGYSSLGYLRRFPFDRIKIDRSFVKDLETSAEGRAIVSSIIALAGELGMSTTVEGVEHRSQLALLRELGCTEAQGYLICEPMLPEDLGLTGATGEVPQYGARVFDYASARKARHGNGEAA